MVEDVKPSESVIRRQRQPQERRSHTRRIKLGPYLLLQTLGEGEFGKVKLGIHTETGQEFAIKLIRKETIGFSPSRLNKVESEIHALRTLKHPYIVKLFNVVETEKYFGIVLEYASGGELFEYIVAHRSLKEKDAQRLFAQLISSVQYMHRKKIVHRDLKLENLLLDRNRNIVVTDFGFANNKQDGLMATSCGSPCYAAPELVVNEGLYAGSAVDIWSCGVILYAMLCGYLPFDDDPCNPDGNNINQLYRYILSTPPKFPNYVSHGAQDLLRKILVADPEKRYTLDKIQQHPWLKSYSELFKKSDDVLEAEAAVMAERSFMPNYRRVAWPPSDNRDTRRKTPAENINVDENRGNGVHGDARIEVKRRRQSKELAILQQRPVTVHGAMLRFNMHRGNQTIADRSRKTQTSFVDRKEQTLKSIQPPPRRERLLSFFTGKTDTSQQRQKQQQQQQQQEQQQQEQVQTLTANELLPVSKLRSKFIASLRVRRKDEFEDVQQKVSPNHDGAVKSSSSTSSINATMGTQQQHQQRNDQKKQPQLSFQQLQEQQQLLNEDEAIALHREKSLHALTSGKTRDQRPRYYSTLGGENGRRAIAVVRNSIYRKTTTATPNNKPATTTDNVYPVGHHSLDITALTRNVPVPENNDKDACQQHQQQQQQYRSEGLTANIVQQENSVSKKMVAWIKRKSQGNKQQQQQQPFCSISTARQHECQKRSRYQQPLPSGENISSQQQKQQYSNKNVDKEEPPSPPEASSQPPLTQTVRYLSNATNNGESRESKCSSTDMLDIRVHRGAVDRAALTTCAPKEIVIKVRKILQALGINCKLDGGYKIICARRPAKALSNSNNNSNNNGDNISNSSTTGQYFQQPLHNDNDKELQIVMQQEEKQDTQSINSSLFPNPGRLSAVTSLKVKRSSSFLSVSTDIPMAEGILPSGQQQPIYGDPSIDSGEEIRFIVEICRFQNLPGLYIVDIRRLRGNVWAYKFLYHKLIDLLGFDKDGYYVRKDPIFHKSYFSHQHAHQQDQKKVVINRDSAIGSSTSPRETPSI